MTLQGPTVVCSEKTTLPLVRAAQGAVDRSRWRVHLRRWAPATWNRNCAIAASWLTLVPAEGSLAGLGYARGLRASPRARRPDQLLGVEHIPRRDRHLAIQPTSRDRYPRPPCHKLMRPVPSCGNGWKRCFFAGCYGRACRRWRGTFASCSSIPRARSRAWATSAAWAKALPMLSRA